MYTAEYIFTAICDLWFLYINNMQTKMIFVPHQQLLLWGVAFFPRKGQLSSAADNCTLGNCPWLSKRDDLKSLFNADSDNINNIFQEHARPRSSPDHVRHHRLVEVYPCGREPQHPASSLVPTVPMLILPWLQPCRCVLPMSLRAPRPPQPTPTSGSAHQKLLLRLRSLNNKWWPWEDFPQKGN